MTLAEQLQEIYEGLPLQDKQRLWQNLTAILQWRGWDRSASAIGGRNSRTKEVDAIADVFLQNGFEVEEYT